MAACRAQKQMKSGGRNKQCELILSGSACSSEAPTVGEKEHWTS
jgi:hypothetical protein